MWTVGRTGSVHLAAVTGDGSAVAAGCVEEAPDPVGCSSAVWMNADGASWQRTDVASSVVDGAFIAAGSTVDGVSQPRIWRSTDGLEWERFGEPQRVDDQVGGSIAALLANADRIIALGDLFVSGAGPHVWTIER